MSKLKIAGIVFAGVVLVCVLAISFSRYPEVPKLSIADEPIKVEDSTTGFLGQPLRAGDVQILAGPLFAGEAFGSSPRTCTTVEYSNVGDAPTGLSTLDWKLQTPGGVILNATIGGSNDELPSGQVAGGGNARGDVCFDMDLVQTGSTLTWAQLFGDELTWTQP